LPADLLKVLGLCVRRPCCPAFLRAAMAELDGPSAALLLLMLKALLGRAATSTSTEKGQVAERELLPWLEALLDANLVSLVSRGGQGGACDPFELRFADATVLGCLVR
jgi:hypothetical protein